MCVLHVSVLPAPGPARGRPEAPLHVSTRGSLRPGLAWGTGAGPAPGQSSVRAARSCPRHGAACVHGGKSWLTSVVLSCRFSGVRTDEAWPVFTLCVFSLSFFIPSSSSSHSAIKQNKLSSLRSARRLVLFTFYPSTVRHVRWDFSSRERRAIPKKGGGPADSGSLPGTATVCLMKSAYCLL